MSNNDDKLLPDQSNDANENQRSLKQRRHVRDRLSVTPPQSPLSVNVTIF
jgi:hypothetical protein